MVSGAVSAPVIMAGVFYTSWDSVFRSVEWSLAHQYLSGVRAVALHNAEAEHAPPSSVITVSLDEKPGVQTLGNTATDLAPQPGRHMVWGRDHEYVRHGTLSILAALDLHDGHIIAQVHERHRSREYIELLKELDTYYPPECTLRIVLDNHSSHISKETMAYLATRPNRFTYVHTPKHGSWLNLIEMAFSRMARSFLRHTRVGSKEEQPCPTTHEPERGVYLHLRWIMRSAKCELYVDNACL